MKFYFHLCTNCYIVLISFNYYDFYNSTYTAATQLAPQPAPEEAVPVVQRSYPH